MSGSDRDPQQQGEKQNQRRTLLAVLMLNLGLSVGLLIAGLGSDYPAR